MALLDLWRNDTKATVDWLSRAVALSLPEWGAVRSSRGGLSRVNGSTNVKAPISSGSTGALRARSSEPSRVADLYSSRRAAARNRRRLWSTIQEGDAVSVQRTTATLVLASRDTPIARLREAPPTAQSDASSTSRKRAPTSASNQVDRK